MRVLQLTQRFSPALGGVENHVQNLATRLSAAGDEVSVLTTDLLRDAPFERLTGDAPSFPYHVHRFPARRLAHLPHGLGIVSPSLAVAALSEPADLIHAHAYGYFPTFAGSLRRVLRQTPLVVTPHSDPGQHTFAKRAFDYIVPAMTLQPAQRIIAVSRGEAQHWTACGVPRDKIEVVPNGVDLREFPCRPDGSRSSEDTTILFVGRCYPLQKGLETLVRAVALLPARLRIRVRIVGDDWGGHDTIGRLASALAISDRITVTGPVAREVLVQEYARADIFVLPSLFEPFGIVLLEAMASGLPVVASRVGGVVEVVEEEKTGLLVEAGNPGQLAGAIARLVLDEHSSKKFGRAGRARAELFSWDAIIPKIKKVYEDTLAECAG